MPDEFKVGDFYTGVRVKTIKEEDISRPRVMPLATFPSEYRVEFPRKYRSENPIGTHFFANVKVCQKHYEDGREKGPRYLKADNHSIQLANDYSPLRQLFAIPIGDRLYEYVDETDYTGKHAFPTLREQAYSASVDNVDLSEGSALTRKRSRLIRSYAIERSKGICEGCDNPAPFTTKNGQPYLEVHHLVPVSQGGADHPINVAAVCPNCHRRTEISEDGDTFNEGLRQKIVKLETQLGQFCKNGAT